jgi:Subtilase family/Fibronectin type-III domain/PA domain/Peptidase inhibitor I9
MAVALVATGLIAAASAGALPADTGGQTVKTYIVQVALDPAVSYDGGIAGLAATKPGKGEKIDPNSAKVVKYTDYLASRHNGLLDKVGGGDKLYDYFYSYDGFAAQLTPAQADKLEGMKGVLAVTPDKLQTADTSSTPHFLGLDEPGGLWEQLGGPTGSKKGPGAGEGMIIGVVDSGIWPESKSFTDRDASGKLVYQSIGGFHGRCESSEIVTDGSWDVNNCNKKLIGARHFNEAWGGDAAIDAERPWEFTSPRDYNGHGSHTTSTAGGNNATPTTGAAAAFGPVSGMAPRARVAMYKALWSTQDASTASGFTSDLVAAIDQAVSDGVDAINYSISGSRTNFLDPVQVSFLFAADAGVFVTASAGNSGPTTGTVAHPGPWLTTVAAGTHNRNGLGSVTLGNNVTYNGASVASAVGPAPLINSEDAGLTGADPTHVALCYSSSDPGGNPLDPAKVAGKIVVCDRGVTARVNKSLAVQEAGGIGMILVNTSINSLNADFHFVPTVHLQSTDRTAVKAYAATPGATAKINQSTLTYTDPAPFTASFSSRGPLAAAGGDLLKPDVIAPGQDILAAVAPPGNHGFDFNLYSGTSMSAPHVAGLGTLLKQLHPSWTPMMVKSALMTSGSDVLDSTTEANRIFRQGAGHVKPNSAADPGLVYNSGFNDWLAFLCGTGQLTASYCPSIKIDPSDLNVASIAIGDLAGVQTVTRKVTNVGSSAATYTASTTGLSGITTSVTPSSLTLAPGETKSFTVDFTRTTATLNAYIGGQLTWTETGGPHKVRMPMVIRPVALAAPASVSGTGDPINYDVKFGYDGPFSATPRGLVAPTITPGTVPDDPGDSFTPGGPGTVSIPVTISAGTTYARFELFNEDANPGSDIDLYVFSGSTQVGASTGGTAAEQVNLLNPPAGNYTVWIHGFAIAGDTPSPFKLYHWLLGSAAAGNMSVTAPSTATTGTTGTITLSFSGLAAATKYLGSVAYSGASGMPNPTIVRVDTP